MQALPVAKLPAGILTAPHAVRVARAKGHRKKSCSVEVLAIDIHPRVARRVGCLAKDVSAVVDAVEVDPLAVVADPIVGRRFQTDHRGKRRPAVLWCWECLIRIN